MRSGADAFVLLNQCPAGRVSSSALRAHLRCPAHGSSGVNLKWGVRERLWQRWPSGSHGRPGPPPSLASGLKWRPDVRCRVRPGASELPNLPSDPVGQKWHCCPVHSRSALRCPEPRISHGDNAGCATWSCRRSGTAAPRTSSPVDGSSRDNGQVSFSPPLWRGQWS